MGLLDVLNGMQNGPGGAPKSGGGGGMSPITMALIGLLAYKAVKSFGGQTAPSGARPPMPSGGNASTSAGGIGDILGGLLNKGAPAGAAAGGGGLGDILGGILGGSPAARGGSGGSIPGGLGGILNSPAAGSILSGGLASVIKELQNNGHGKAAQSWVSRGENEQIEPDDLAKALGSDSINAMVEHTGISREELLDGLSQQLPQLVDHLTPDGRLPTEAEAARMV